MIGRAAPSAPVSWGELLDKLSILEIKQARIADPQARANVDHERQALHRIALAVLDMPEIAEPLERLRTINAELWEIEDAIRAEDAAGRFGDRFVALARAVYRRNDERAATKRRINQALGSELVEEKSYWSAPA